MEDNEINTDQEQPKLTKWADEPKVADLRLDLENARTAHNAQMSKIQGWEDLRDVKGTAAIEPIKGKSSIQPRLIRQQAEWRYSALSEPFLGTEQMYKVRPATFEDKKAALQNELVLNHQMRNQINTVEFIDSLVRCTVDEGTSLTKVSWLRETIEEEVEVPVFDYYPVESQEEMDTLQQAMELQQSNPRGFYDLPEEVQAAVEYVLETQTPVIAVVKEYTKVMQEKVLKNQPHFEIRDPRNVTIDPTCGGDLDRAKFIVDSYETCRADLEGSAIDYKNLDKVKWETSSIDTDPDHETNTPKDFKFTDKARKGVVVYEYWGFYDIDGTGTLSPIVAAWIGDVMIRMERNPYPDGKLPYVIARYMPKKRELYGEPDAELLSEHQKLNGALVRGIVDSFARTANGQRGFPKGFVDPMNARKMHSGADFEYNPDAAVNGQGFIQAQYPEIPQSVYQFLQLNSQQAEGLTGVKSFAGGMSGEAYGKVAAGIRGMLDASSKREMAILRRVSKAVVALGVKVASMNAVFLSEKEVVRITNDEFVEVNREDLKGNFDIIVDIATAEVDDAQSQDLAFMIQTLGNSVDFGITKLFLTEIVRLKRMPDLARAIEAFNPQPSPEEQRMMELGLQIKEAELQKLQSEIAYNQARAQQAYADAENTAIDTHNEANGVKHQQKMEQQKAQSQGNQQYAITQALTKPRKQGEVSGDIEAAIGYNALTS